MWAVRDRVHGTRCALKVLAKDAGELELVALVREAVALSGLEGLGVPRVLAFGALEDKRRYMVRELVEGRSTNSWWSGPPSVSGSSRSRTRPISSRRCTARGFFTAT